MRIFCSYPPAIGFKFAPENIFRGEKVFAGANLKPIAGGFEQNIRKAGVYAIKYTVLKGNIVFRDTLSNILIKVKENR